MDAAWNFRYPQSLHEIKTCATALGNPGFSSLYLRHGGASADRADGARSVNSIWTRNLWKSKSSLDINEKATRLASEMSRYSPTVVIFMRHGENALKTTLLHGRNLLTPRLSVRENLGWKRSVLILVEVCWKVVCLASAVL